MSARRTYTIHCDHEHEVEGNRFTCPATFTAGIDNATTTRSLAHASGWRTVVVPRPTRSGPASSLDLCPAHPAPASSGQEAS